VTGKSVISNVSRSGVTTEEWNLPSHPADPAPSGRTTASAGPEAPPAPAVSPVDAKRDHRDAAPGSASAGHAFADLADYVAIPRLGGLALSPDGTRLVTSVSTLSADKKKYVTALWEIDPAGARSPRRLTRSAPGESQPVFLSDGGLLFTSKRPDPQVDDPDTDRPALWLLPDGAGEARQIAARPGGIGSVAAARDAAAIVFSSDVLPGAATSDEDKAKRTARKDAGVSAILHRSYPVRYWDHDIGPAQTRVFAADAVQQADERLDDPRDLTPTPEGRVGGDIVISPDGTLVAYGWDVDDEAGSRRATIVIADRATGDRRTVVDDAGFEYGQPAFSPDSSTLVCVRDTMPTWSDAPRTSLWQVDLATGDGRALASSFPGWPMHPTFSADGTAVFFLADEAGHAPVFRLDLTSDVVTRLTAHGAHSDLVVSRDGAHLYAMRTSYAQPATPVRLDPATTDQEGATLSGPGDVGTLPGTVVEVSTHADDGTPLRAWLVLPDGASATAPAPLLLWIHGGPLSSWNAWSWRWNPWLLASQGYAVLLPDPALSTGYGQDFIDRGWGTWGDRPFTDLMSITDATCARDDIDDTRTAAMGGSFGGYMANWVATHTDRFKAIVTHASLWDLEGFSGTTDVAWYWQREFGDPLATKERYEANSPHLFVRDIRTPMLVVHGDKDYRVPIGEGLKLWWDLVRHQVDSSFLYFPDENHWVLTPGNAKVWYDTVRAFLAHHVLGEPWRQPDMV
jgi:dipeptidyl aminopeptidase/acylaminoacyl peptidase